MAIKSQTTKKSVRTKKIGFLLPVCATSYRTSLSIGSVSISLFTLSLSEFRVRGLVDRDVISAPEFALASPSLFPECRYREQEKWQLKVIYSRMVKGKVCIRA